MAGQASVLSIPNLFGGAGGGKGAVGGSVVIVTYDNNDKAYIDDGAKVRAGHDINVNANTFNFMVSAAQAGAKAEKYGVGGAVNFGIFNDTTLLLEDGHCECRPTCKSPPAIHIRHQRYGADRRRRWRRRSASFASLDNTPTFIGDNGVTGVRAR